MPRYGTIDMEYGAFLSTRPAEDDGRIFMVNLMRYRQAAEYRRTTDGAPGEGEVISGQEADDRYAPTDVLADIGADVAFMGQVVAQGGAVEERWDRIGVVRYPTRRSFIEMQSRNDFRAKHVHKDAGMEFTIVMGCLPPAGAAVVHDHKAALRWEAWTDELPAAPALPHLDLAVEGTIIGDERRFRHLRLVWGDESADSRGADLVLVTRPSIDRMARLAETFHG